MDKWNVKVKERLVMTTPLRLLLVLRTHWLVEVEVSSRQLPELTQHKNSCNTSQNINLVGQHL